MLKKLLSFVFAAFMSVALMAGCSFISVNTTSYYSQVVAEVVFDDYTKSFTMKDLLSAYSSYSSNYSQSGYSTEETVKAVLNLMIDRAILVDELKTQITLSDAEKQQLMRDTYENINTTIAELEDTIKTEWNIAFEDGEAVTEADPLRTAQDVYEPTVIMENGELIRVVTPSEIIDPTPAGDFVQTVGDVAVSAEAMQRYYRQLKSAADIEGLKDQTNQQLLEREINRIYTILEENKYIEKYQEQYLNNQPINSDAVVQRYKEMYLRDQAKYTNNLTAYYTQMKSDASSVYYHPVSNAYLQVTHILVKFSEDQNTQIAQLNSQLESNTISQSVYDYRLQLIKNQTVATYENEAGETVTMPYETMYNNLYNAVYSVGNYGAKVQTQTELVERAKLFDQYLYKYNEDTGIVNSDFAYVVNLQDLSDTYGVSDIMIPEFTDAARELYTDTTNYGLGTISQPVFAEFSDGEYGYHVILNLGVVSNIVSPGNINNVTWQALYGKTTQPSLDKTIFHVIYDDLDLDSSLASTQMSQMVSTVKAQEVVTYKLYTSRYKSLWEQ